MPQSLIPLAISFVLNIGVVVVALTFLDGPSRAFIVSLVSIGWLQGFLCGSTLKMFLANERMFAALETEIPPNCYNLHWNPNKERRGIGDLVKQLNHVALIVSDVGRSLAFYVEILGLQQIQRPNFDRHGAWLTLGNTELHLIKGVPVVHSGEDLIVSHMSLESERPDLILEKLIELNVPFRQNISVPDPKKARENLVENFTDSKGKVTQYFIRDPDGYYFELCNCQVLTKFCLEAEAVSDMKHKIMDDGGLSPILSAICPQAERRLVDMLFSGYSESGNIVQSEFRCPMLFKVGCVVARAIRRARKNLRRDISDRVEEAMRGVVSADTADKVLMTRLTNRTKTYSDVTQGFTINCLAKALKQSGNHCPTAILILKSFRDDETVMLPPVYLVNEGGDAEYDKNMVAQHVHKTKRDKNFLSLLGSMNMFAGASFKDNDSKRTGYDVNKDANRKSLNLEGSTSSFDVAQFALAHKRRVRGDTLTLQEADFTVAQKLQNRRSSRISFATETIQE